MFDDHTFCALLLLVSLLPIIPYIFIGVIVIFMILLCLFSHFVIFELMEILSFPITIILLYYVSRNQNIFCIMAFISCVFIYFCSPDYKIRIKSIATCAFAIIFFVKSYEIVLEKNKN